MKLIILPISLAMALAATPCLAGNTSSSEAAAAAAGARYTVDSKISDLLGDPHAAEVLKAFVRQQCVAAGKPEPSTEQQARLIDFVREMTPREVARFPEAHMDDAALARLNVLLAGIRSPATASAGGPPQG